MRSIILQTKCLSLGRGTSGYFFHILVLGNYFSALRKSNFHLLYVYAQYFYPKTIIYHLIAQHTKHQITYILELLFHQRRVNKAQSRNGLNWKGIPKLLFKSFIQYSHTETMAWTNGTDTVGNN